VCVITPGRRLDEREARHDFLAEHGLLNMRKVQALDRRRTGAERDTHARLRVFARYRCVVCVGGGGGASFLGEADTLQIYYFHIYIFTNMHQDTNHTYALIQQSCINMYTNTYMCMKDSQPKITAPPIMCA